MDQGLRALDHIPFALAHLPLTLAHLCFAIGHGALALLAILVLLLLGADPTAIATQGGETTPMDAMRRLLKQTNM